MRLVDADFLATALSELRGEQRPWKNESYRLAVADCLTLLHCAPTVACERCEWIHRRTFEGPECSWLHIDVEPGEFGCSNFKEAQP